MAVPHKIVIVLEGGIIQEIAGIPAGIVVEVRDFDEIGEADFDKFEDEIHETKDGEKYIATIWTQEG